MPIGLAGGLAAAGSVVSAGVGVAGALGSSGGIASGQSAANAAQTQAYNQYAANEQPYISTGTNALSGAADAAGLNGATGYQNALSGFEASPGYQYQLKQGLSAIDNGAASIGTLRSGNTVRAEETLGSNLANQDFTAYYNRLAGLAGQGQTATSALGSAGVSTGAGIAGTDASAATAQAGLNNTAAKGVGDAINGVASNKAVQNGLSSLFTPTSYTSSANNVATNGLHVGGT